MCYLKEHLTTGCHKVGFVFFLAWILHSDCFSLLSSLETWLFDLFDCVRKCTPTLLVTTTDARRYWDKCLIALSILHNIGFTWISECLKKKYVYIWQFCKGEIKIFFFKETFIFVFQNVIDTFLDFCTFYSSRPIICIQSMQLEDVQRTTSSQIGQQGALLFNKFDLIVLTWNQAK